MKVIMWPWVWWTSLFLSAHHHPPPPNLLVTEPDGNYFYILGPVRFRWVFVNLSARSGHVIQAQPIRRPHPLCLVQDESVT